MRSNISLFFKQIITYVLGCYSLFIFLNSTVTAGTMGSAEPTSPWWVGTPAVTLGGYWGSQGQEQDVPIIGLIGDRFTVTKRHDGGFVVGLSYFLKSSHFAAQPLRFGVAGFYLDKAVVTGNVIQEDLFANLSYRYRLRHIPLYALARTTVALAANKASVELDAGIGPNFIRTSGFSEASLDGGITLPDAIFTSHNQTVFSATAGVSLALPFLALDSHPLSCGYRFFYLGQGQFKTRTDQVTRALNTGTTYANALACTLKL